MAVLECVTGEFRWTTSTSTSGHLGLAARGVAKPLLLCAQHCWSDTVYQAPGSVWDLSKAATAGPGPQGARRLDNCPGSPGHFASRHVTNDTCILSAF